MARLLQFKPSAVSYILYKQPAKYQVFSIPKRRGGTRTIKAPTEQLKLLQQKLSLLLQDCLDEINTAKQRKDKLAHGFKRERSIITNARQHRNRRHVFNLDLQDFFPSINFGRVRGFFIKDKNFSLAQEVATVIAQIACDDNSLPQGSPCSPVISNLIAHVLDIRILRIVTAVGCTYSRYADDLTFSTNKKEVPPEIARPDATNPHVWTPGAPLVRTITRAGFAVNPTKTHMQYRTSRQEVTGLVVNEKINVRHEYRHEVRAMVHTLFTTGKFTLYGPVTKNGVVTIDAREGTLNELHGRLGFIDSIDRYNKRTVPEQKHTPLSKKERMYRQFLIYKDFYTAERPVIVCEGKTDIVYLKYAIRNLATHFPQLAEIAADGKITLKVRLYKYHQSNTARILGLSDGGNSVLPKFIGTYREDTAKFRAPGQQQPIIVLYDNDVDAPKIRKAIKDAVQVTVNGTEPYMRVVRNLYAMPTPIPAGQQESIIEDFFDSPTKGTMLGGKTFNKSNQFDTAKHYGKHIFAEQVIKTRASTINFDGFRLLLTVLEDIIKDHAKTVASAATAP